MSKSKYYNVEKDAVNLLTKISNRELTFNDIDEGFVVIHNEMNNLMNEDDDGVIVLSEETPFWITELISWHFIEWHQWHMLRRLSVELPEKFNESLKEKYKEIERLNLDEKFLGACDECFAMVKNKLLVL